MNNLADGLRIVGVGIIGVFINLLVLMVVVQVLGKVFGVKKKKGKKKKKKVEQEASPTTGDAVATPPVETASVPANESA